MAAALCGALSMATAGAQTIISVPVQPGTGLALSGGAMNLQPAGPATIGGVNSITCATHAWLNTISTLGVPTCAQPAIGDISGWGTGVAAALGNTAGGTGGFALNSQLASYLALAGGTMSGNIAMGGNVLTGAGANYVTNTNLAQAAAGTFKGNPTASTSNEQDFTVQGLPNNSSPSATLDLIPIYNHTTGAIQNVSPSQIATAVGSGVTSFNSRAGAVVPGSSDYTAPQIGYTPPGTGGVATTAQVKFQQTLWATDYGASGSSQSTAGSISSSSSSLSLSSALDFVNGQGVTVVGAASASGLGTPSALGIACGVAGSTSYTYIVVPINGTGGTGTKASVTSSTCGAVSATAFNTLTWTAASGSPVGYAVYNSTGLLALVGGTTFFDVGVGNVPFPYWLPVTPPTGPQPNWLVTTISSGGGTTTLTLANAATTTVSSGAVVHNDTNGLQALVTKASSLQAEAKLNCPGSFHITSPITWSVGSPIMSGCGSSYVSGTQTASILLDSPIMNGLVLNSNQTASIHDFNIIANAGTAVGAISGNAIFGTGTGLFDSIYNMVLAGCFSCINESTQPLFHIHDNFLTFCSQSCINAANPGDNTISDNLMSVSSIPGYSSAVGIEITGDCGGTKAHHNKINGSGFSYVEGILCAYSGSISDGDFDLDGNSIESYTQQGVLVQRTSGTSLFGNINIRGGNIGSASAGAVPIFFSTNANWLSNVSISGVALSGGGNCIEILGGTMMAIGPNNYSACTDGVNIASSNVSSVMLYGGTFNGVSTQFVTTGATSVFYAGSTTTPPTYP